MMRNALRTLAVVAALVGAPLAARAHGMFTFRDAEFMPLDSGLDAAREFVATRLPSGLPLADARDRLHHADMRCAKRPENGAMLCDFADVVHVEGGVLGEEHWTVHLTTDASEILTAATLDYFVIGAGRPSL